MLYFVKNIAMFLNSVEFVEFVLLLFGRLAVIIVESSITLTETGQCLSTCRNKLNDLILNLTQENMTQHSRIE